MNGAITIMKTKMLIMLALIVILVLAASAPSVASADGAVVPFKAFYAGVPVGEFKPGPPPYLDQKFEFDGQATHLGLSHMSATGEAYMSPPMEQFGDITFIAANGDELYVHYTGNWQVVSPGVVTFGGEYQATGGSGRFLNNTGSGVYWGTATANVWGEIYFDGLLYK
jgi:hypothetical protein